MRFSRNIKPVIGAQARVPEIIRKLCRRLAQAVRAFLRTAQNMPCCDLGLLGDVCLRLPLGPRVAPVPLTASPTDQVPCTVSPNTMALTQTLPAMDAREVGPCMRIETPRAIIETPCAAPPAARGDRKMQSAVALRAFCRLAVLWKLSVREQMILLGMTARSSFFKWKKHPDVALPKDTLERISYLLRIDDALRSLSSEAAAANAWLRQPNPAPPFGGCSALEQMLAGRVADLFEVHRYLDAQRSG